MLSHIILFSKFCNCHNSIINKCFQSAILSSVTSLGSSSEDKVGDHHHGNQASEDTANHYRDGVVAVICRYKYVELSVIKRSRLTFYKETKG